jgi:hypothetical protein
VLQGALGEKESAAMTSFAPRSGLILALPAILAGSTALASPADAVLRRRFALVIGANDGGSGRQLRHAVSDAHQMADVLFSLGGVRPEDGILIENPSVEEFRVALKRIRDGIARAGADHLYTELVFYYSGHSDDEGLLLRGDPLPYVELRRDLDSLGTDFRVAILDSCSSGSFARAKGGSRVPPFLADASVRVKGEAIITSSSAAEVSQESDAIGGSYFTSNLLAGLRGAADLTHDGKVTLSEAYRFAFDETLAGTEKTEAGAQHPAYEMALAGTGDVVITDLRGSAAVLTLPSDLAGDFRIRDHDGQLVLELRKRSGNPIDLGLDVGEYTVVRSTEAKRAEAKVVLSQGTHSALSEADFTALTIEPAVPRGLPPPESAVSLSKPWPGGHYLWLTLEGSGYLLGLIGTAAAVAEPVFKNAATMPPCPYSYAYQCSNFTRFSAAASQARNMATYADVSTAVAIVGSAIGIPLAVVGTFGAIRTPKATAMPGIAVTPTAGGAVVSSRWSF